MPDEPADPVGPPTREDAFDLSQWAIRCAERWEWGKASDAMQKARLLAPASCEDLGALFRRLQTLGQMQDAVQLLRNALKDVPEAAPELWNALGCFELELRRPEAAVQACRRAVAGAPDRPAFLANLGLALCVGGSRAEAEGCLRRALALAPEDARIAQLALLLDARGDAMGLLFLSGIPEGVLLPALAYAGESFGEGRVIRLLAEQGDIWTVSVGRLASAPPLHEGALVVASLSNTAGLFLKVGRLGAARGARKSELDLQGPPAGRLQRRRHLRFPVTEDFVRADERVPGQGEGEALRRLLADLSPRGLSYVGTPPPSVGGSLEFRLRFPEEEVTVPGVVRSVTPAAKVGVEFTTDEATVDRIARLLHARLRQAEAPPPADRALYRSPFWGAVEALSAFPSAEAVERLLAVTAPHEKAAASGVLAKLLAHGEARVRQEAVLGLGRLREPSSAALVAKHLESPAPMERAATALALGELGEASVVPALGACLEDPVAGVRRTAARALGRIAGENWPEDERGVEAARAWWRVRRRDPA